MTQRKNCVLFIIPRDNENHHEAIKSAGISIQSIAICNGNHAQQPETSIKQNHPRIIFVLKEPNDQNIFGSILDDIKRCLRKEKIRCNIFIYTEGVKEAKDHLSLSEVKDKIITLQHSQRA